MKASELKQIIREEIHKVLSEDLSIDKAGLKKQFSKIDWDSNGDDLEVSDIKPGMALKFASDDPKFKKDPWLKGIVLAVDKNQVTLALAKDKGKTVVTTPLKYMIMLSDLSSEFVRPRTRSTGGFEYQHPRDRFGFNDYQHPRDRFM